MNTKIHETHSTFTQEQRARKINWCDIMDARRIFGYLVGLQMGKDKQAGSAFWDSCSMIEQAWEKFGPEPAEAFVQWALERIREV